MSHAGIGRLIKDGQGPNHGNLRKGDPARRQPSHHFDHGGALQACTAGV